MKKLALSLFILATSNLGFAAQTYEAEVTTKTLGKFKLVLTLDTKNLSAEAYPELNYFQERIDNGVWGDFFCINQVNFEGVLALTAKLYTADGKFVSEFSNSRYDQRKPVLKAVHTEQSREPFACEEKNIVDVATVRVDGLDAEAQAGEFTVEISLLQGAIAEASLRKLDNSYVLDSFNINQLVTSTRSRVQFSINKRHRTHVNNYEWMYVNLISK